MVWNKKTGKTADIVRIFEGGYFTDNRKAKYRVDYNGRTVGTLIDNFQRARSIATKLVK